MEHGKRAGLSPCHRPPNPHPTPHTPPPHKPTHEAHHFLFVSSVDNVPIDNTEFKLHNLDVVDVVGLRHDKVSKSPVQELCAKNARARAYSEVSDVSGFYGNTRQTGQKTVRTIASSNN